MRYLHDLALDSMELYTFKFRPFAVHYFYNDVLPSLYGDSWWVIHMMPEGRYGVDGKRLLARTWEFFVEELVIRKLAKPSALAWAIPSFCLDDSRWVEQEDPGDHPPWRNTILYMEPTIGVLSHCAEDINSMASAIAYNDVNVALYEESRNDPVIPAVFRSMPQGSVDALLWDIRLRLEDAVTSGSREDPDALHVKIAYRVLTVNTLKTLREMSSISRPAYP